MSPRADARIKNRWPAISATVRDAQTNLAKSNITLYVDGRRKNFAYNAGTDRLVYRSARLAYKKHTVRIVARDAQGKVGTRAWRFLVIR